MDIWVGYLNMWHGVYKFTGVDMVMGTDMDMKIESPGYMSGCK